MTVAEKKEWYLEYEIEINRPGLLGDVSSLLGMLGISIVTINGVDQGKRGLLIKTDNLEKVERFEQIARGINEIEITKLALIVQATCSVQLIILKTTLNVYLQWLKRLILQKKLLIKKKVLLQKK